MLVAAVSMVCARCHTAAVGTELIFGATAAASLLTDDFPGQPSPCSDDNCRQRSLQERPAMTEGGQLPGEDIESVRIHRFP